MRSSGNATLRSSPAHFRTFVLCATTSRERGVSRWINRNEISSVSPSRGSSETWEPQRSKETNRGLREWFSQWGQTGRIEYGAVFEPLARNFFEQPRITERHSLPQKIQVLIESENWPCNAPKSKLTVESFGKIVVVDQADDRLDFLSVA